MTDTRATVKWQLNIECHVTQLWPINEHDAVAGRSLLVSCPLSPSHQPVRDRTTWEAHFFQISRCHAHILNHERSGKRLRPLCRHEAHWRSHASATTLLLPLPASRRKGSDGQHDIRPSCNFKIMWCPSVGQCLTHFTFAPLEASWPETVNHGDWDEMETFHCFQTVKIKNRPMCSKMSRDRLETKTFKNETTYLIFSERERELYVIVRPSVCRLSVCLSSVTFVHPTQAIEIFGNVSTPFGTLATHGHPSKILRRSS